MHKDIGPRCFQLPRPAEQLRIFRMQHGLVIIQGLIGNIIGEGELCDHFMSTRIFILIRNKMFILSFKDYEGSGYGLDLDLLIISY